MTNSTMATSDETTQDGATREVEALRAQLAEAESKLAEAQEVLRAIQSGDVDAVVVSGSNGEQVFTLKGAEYAYRLLVEAMNEGAATLGADGIVLYCNQRLADLFGISLERIIGRPVAQLVGQESKHEIETIIARAFNGDTAKAELELHQLKGLSIPVYISLREMKGDDPAALCMVVTDLTEQKKWDEQLAAEEILRKQAELLKLSFDAIIIWRPDGGIESWNTGAELLYGYPESEAMGQMTNELLATVHPKPWPEIEADLFNKGFWEGELRHHACDGREIVVSGRKQVIQDANGSICVLEINRDITERKRMERALLNSAKLAATARLASTMSHEINNPLGAITNLIYLLAPLQTTPEARSYVATLDDQVRGLTRIATQMLKFHRDNNHPTEFKLEELLREVLTFYRPLAEKQGIDLTQRIETEGIVEGFRGEVIQVVTNLLLNALDATPPGGKVCVHLYAAPPWLCKIHKRCGYCLSVADTGSGMNPQNYARIFEPFFTTKGDKGSGLGLWLCAGIVSRVGGSIRVWSSRLPNHSGTCFSVFLPAEEVTSTPRRRRYER
jgi:PAS domain S-box-containing protein